MSASKSKRMPLAECRMNDPDENLSWNQYTSSLYLSQERELGIAKQKRYLARHVATFLNHRERENIQETGPAVIKKKIRFSLFLVNSEDLSKSMIKADYFSWFPLLCSFLLGALCPMWPTISFLSSALPDKGPFLTCLPRAMLCALIVYALRSDLALQHDSSSYWAYDFR